MSPPGPPRPARVINLLSTLAAGGVQRAVLELASHLDRSRFVPEVWYFQGAGEVAPAFRARDIAVRKVRLVAHWDLSVVPRLTFSLRHHRAEILHTHDPAASAFGRISAPNAGIRTVIATEHGVTHWSTPETFINRLVRATAHRADFVVSVSDAVAYLATAAGAARREKSRVIHDGVSIPAGAGVKSASAKAAARARFHLPAEGPIVASIGSLTQEKGFSQMIEAMPLILSERADAFFVIGGAGPGSVALERQARGLGVADRLIFSGRILDPHEFLPAADVFLLPSLTEGYGIGALEAMAHGIPVVATRVGGIPELVTQGEGGLLVNANAPREMAAVVLYLLNSDLYAAEVGAAGRRKAETSGSAARMAAEYMDLYDEALRGRRKA